MPLPPAVPSGDCHSETHGVGGSSGCAPAPRSPTPGSRADVTCHEGHRLPQPTSALTMCPPPSADPRVCAHRVPPAQAQRQAPQARLAVRQAAPAQLCQHGEGAAVTGLQTRVVTLCPEAPAHLPASPPTLEVLWGGARSWGWQMQRLPAAQAGVGWPQTRGRSHSAGARTLGPVPWPARSCSPRARCTAFRRTWRSGHPPAPSRCLGTAAPGSSTGLWSRC